MAYRHKGVTVLIYSTAFYNTDVTNSYLPTYCLTRGAHNHCVHDL